jgi:hypothetical protein
MNSFIEEKKLKIRPKRFPMVSLKDENKANREKPKWLSGCLGDSLKMFGL